MTEKEFRQQLILLCIQKPCTTAFEYGTVENIVGRVYDNVDCAILAIKRRDPNFFSETEASIQEPQLLKEEKSYVREMSLNQFANMLPDVYATRFHNIINSFNNGAYNNYYDNMKLNTVSDLLKIGKIGFLKLRCVGRKMLAVVDDTLERYGITDW